MRRPGDEAKGGVGQAHGAKRKTLDLMLSVGGSHLWTDFPHKSYWYLILSIRVKDKF